MQKLFDSMFWPFSEDDQGAEPKGSPDPGSGRGPILLSARHAVDQTLSSDAKAVIFVLAGLDGAHIAELQKYLRDLSPRAIAEATDELVKRGVISFTGDDDFDVSEEVEVMKEWREEKGLD